MTLACPGGVVQGPDWPRVSTDGGRGALFLDRDGIVNVNHGYVHTVDRTDWVPGIFALCAAARDAGYSLVIVTNQAGIGRGYYDEAGFRRYSEWMHAQFAQRGVPLTGIYFCPCHPDAGLGRYRRDCECRKPAPGMLLRAAADIGIELGASILVGDSISDVQAAQAAGVRLAVLFDNADQGLASLAGLFTPVLAVEKGTST
nr:HAD family hydrolase [Xanthomonas sp. XNM01]